MSAYILKNCSTCGTGFDGLYASKYCSKECNPRSPKKELVKFDCLTCGVEVESRKRKNFCSSFCKSVYVENLYGGEPQVSFVRFSSGNSY